MNGACRVLVVIAALIQSCWAAEPSTIYPRSLVVVADIERSLRFILTHWAGR